MVQKHILHCSCGKKNSNNRQKGRFFLTYARGCGAYISGFAVFDINGWQKLLALCPADSPKVLFAGKQSPLTEDWIMLKYRYGYGQNSRKVSGRYQKSCNFS